MFKSYLTIAIRHLHKRKDLTLINILGLSIGMTCAVLILLYVQYERNYDRFHPFADRIYRVVEGNGPFTNPNLGAVLVDDLPEIMASVRLVPTSNYWLMQHEGTSYQEYDVYQTEPALFDFFNFPLLTGDPLTALRDPGSAIISASKARTYFGNENPIGKSIMADDHDLTITAVMSDLPADSHIRADFFTSFTSLKPDENDGGFWTYMLLSPEASVTGLDDKVSALDARIRRLETPSKAYLQPMTDIHLFSELENDISARGDPAFLLVLSLLGVFMLLIAIINFTNLATARSAGRTLEVGLRKTIGAQRSQLVLQFLAESLLVACMTMPVTFVFIQLGLPWMNTVLEKSLVFDLHAIITHGPALATIVLVVGVASGAYPALFLSGFKPIAALNSRMQVRSARGTLRRLLVVVQFTMTVALITGALLVRAQLDYLRDKPLGFAEEQVVTIIGPPNGYHWYDYQVWKTDIMRYSGVLGVSRPAFQPGKDVAYYRLTADLTNAQPVEIAFYPIDEDFVETMGLERLAGASLPPGWQANPQYKPVVLNETAARRFGWVTPQEAIGKDIINDRERDADPGNYYRATVFTVVKDFHLRSLHYPVEPLVMEVWRELWQGRPFVRIATEDAPETLSYLKRVWEHHEPEVPFSYLFMDGVFDRLYEAEARLSQAVFVFVGLTVLIAGMGLFGLVSFLVEQRTREIGIRKILGESTGGIMRLLAAEFVKLVLIANLIAWPIVYLVLSQWLQTFAYRIDIGLLPFLISGIAALGIVLVTVGRHAVKAASINPAEALRYE